MHNFDPNGAIHAYRKDRDRRECYRTILFTIGVFCALVFIVCAAFVTLSMFGK